MSIWIPLSVLVVAPITIWIVAACIDMEPAAAANLGLVVTAGAALVLADRTLVASIAPGAAHQPVWADWAWLAGVHAPPFSP
jgi:hypothetical protein